MYSVLMGLNVCIFISVLVVTSLKIDTFDQVPDILEKNSHSTCPKSMIETTKMYNPNMKVDILAIPPRVSEDNVCCKWRFSMRDEDDPEYVAVDLVPKPSAG